MYRSLQAPLSLAIGARRRGHDPRPAVAEPPTAPHGRPVLEALELLLEPGSVAELRAIGPRRPDLVGVLRRPGATRDGGRGPRRRRRVPGDLRHAQPRAPRAARPPGEPGPDPAREEGRDHGRRRYRPPPLAARSTSTRPGRAGSRAPRDEHRAACRTAQAVRDVLAGQGWPAPIVADSGNGAHLLYRVDLPNDAASTALVKAVLGALDARFSDGRGEGRHGELQRGADLEILRHGRAGRATRPGTGPTAARRSSRGRTSRRSCRPSSSGRSPASLPRARAAGCDAGTAAGQRPRPRRLAPRSTGSRSRRRSPGRTGRSTPWRSARSRTPTRTARTRSSSGTARSTPAASTTACGGGRQRWRELRERFEPGPRGTRP